MDRGGLLDGHAERAIMLRALESEGFYWQGGRRVAPFATALQPENLDLGPPCAKSDLTKYQHLSGRNWW
jgi:hypothetical protein